MKILKEPLLHFLLLGALIFAFSAWIEGRRPDQTHAARIEVTGAVIERLRAGYERQFGQKPDEMELRGLIAAHVREEVLSREALALGLDRDDTIVRRRLAQKMEFLTDDLAVTAEPEPAVLEHFFKANEARYARPARVSFRHVYFSREKRGAGLESAAAGAFAALGKGADDAVMGDAFLHGFEFVQRDPEELTALFGPEFSGQLATLPLGAWSGPVASGYGLHLVRVEGRSASRASALAEVRATVIRDFLEEQRQTANREVFERLKQRYHITVDESAIAKLPDLRTAEVTK